MNDAEQDAKPLVRSSDHGENPLSALGSVRTAGQMLHAARKASGMSIEELSARVKVPVSRLIALEEDRLESWPDPNVVRAVAATVCRQVQLDPVLVLGLLPKARQTALVPPSADTAVSFYDRSVLNLRGTSGIAGTLPKRVALAVGLAALVLAVLVFGSQLQSQWSRWVDRVSEDQATPAETSVQDPVMPPDAGPTDTRSSSAVGDAAAEAPSLSGAVGLPQSIQARGDSDGASRPSPAAPQAAVLPRPLVSFKATGASWIEVTDAKGDLLLRRTLASGDVASASGEVPLFVVVGRADHTEVEVRGQPLKLEPSSTGNVARFKVQ